MTTRWLQTHIAKRPSQFSIDRVFYNPIDRCSGETRCSGLCLVLGCLAAVFSSEKKEQRVLNGFDHFVESTNQFWWLKEPYAHGRIQEVDHCGDAGFHRCKSQLDIYIYMIWQSGCGQESDGTPQSSVMFFPLQTAWVPKRPRSEVSLCRVQGQSRQKDFESTVFLRRSMIHGSGRRGDRRNAWSADRPREAE